VSLKQALLVINRKSRSGQTDLSAGLDLLKDRGLTVKEAVVDQPESIPELIRQHREKVDRIIVAGGDGTLNAAAEAMIEIGLPLGILPIGTANDLARTLGIPTELPEACAVIAEGYTHAIDVGWVNGVYYFNVAHIGLGVQVTHQLSAEVKARWGILGYLHGIFKAFQENRAFRAHITFDNRHRRTKSIEIAIGNGRHYGGGMTIAEEATIYDHQLYLYSLKPLSLWKLITLAPALRSGRYAGQDGVELLKAQEITIRTRKPMSIDTDGELRTHTPAHFRVIPAALSVYVTEPYANHA
jgi:YegS/Rv2252/BmrU family lipid kinase